MGHVEAVPCRAVLCSAAGASCHAAEPGFFRMCWAWPHPDSIPVAVQRMAAAIQQFRQAQRDVRAQQQSVDQVQKAQQQLQGLGWEGTKGPAAVVQQQQAAIM